MSEELKPVAWASPIAWKPHQSEQCIKVTRDEQKRHGFTQPLYAAALASRDAEVQRLRDALEQIAAIEDQMYGLDWDEIEQARAIARDALKEQQ